MGNHVTFKECLRVWGQISSTAVKTPLLKMPANHNGVAGLKSRLHSCFQLPINAHSERQK